jgi:CRP/FNR family cyclic AMP-dependent transcriptional regulator
MQPLSVLELIQHFRDAGIEKTLPPGSVLFRDGDEPDFVYLLMEGQANIMVGETIVEVASRGALLGEVALIDGKPRSGKIVTRTKCTVAPIDAGQFELLLQEMPAFGQYVMKAMAERMRRMNDNLRAAQTVRGVHARVSTNTSLSMEEDATLPPYRSPTKPG